VDALEELDKWKRDASIKRKKGVAQVLSKIDDPFEHQ
jgi:hypothetical protein